MSENLPIITKYRPSAWDELIGHESIVGALQRRLKEASHAHTYLLTGPSGTGKTTIARIIAKELGCDEVIEIDAASNSGVDPMRDIVNLASYRSLSGSGKRMFLIDECHTLSKNAWQVLLKITEEPPEYLYFAFCTTEANKVPETLKTRAYPVPLKAVGTQDIATLLDTVILLEEWTVDPSVLSLVLHSCTGSPRKALIMLQSVHDLQDRTEAERVIQLVDDNADLIELCRFIISGSRNWKELVRLLANIEDDVLDQASIPVGRYILSVMLKAEKEDAAKRCWTLIDALLFPTQTFDPKLAFIAAIGRMYWAE